MYLHAYYIIFSVPAAAGYVVSVFGLESATIYCQCRLIGGLFQQLIIWSIINHYISQDDAIKLLILSN